LRPRVLATFSVGAMNRPHRSAAAAFFSMPSTSAIVAAHQISLPT